MFSIDKTTFLQKLYNNSSLHSTLAKDKAIIYLLTMLEQDPRITLVEEAAYILATIRWETADTFRPIKEKKYNPIKNPSAYWRQTRYWITGYYGRGYVQLTWKDNYRKAGEGLSGMTFAAQGHRITIGPDTFSNDPDLVMEPDIAYAICSYGMTEGWFTGRKLGDYFSATCSPDYIGGRHIINGSDHATDIAAMADVFASTLNKAIQPQ